jgi:nitrite reductase (NO-forming)
MQNNCSSESQVSEWRTGQAVLLTWLKEEQAQSVQKRSPATGASGPKKEKPMNSRPLGLLAGTAALLIAGALAAPALADSAVGVMPMAPVARGSAEAPVDIVRLPTDLPPPIGVRGPQKVVVNLETVEVYGKLDDGTSYQYWTFNGKVPGPFLRVRVGDSVEVHLTNAADSAMMHNVDFHAVIGPGGGARATEAAPGESKSFTFKALSPGLFVYHCATPPVAQHISSGMYGLILVEPEGGLPKVDHEFYVMQGEIYTDQPFGTKGEVTASYDKLINERPEYYVFNGAVGGISTAHPLQAKVGETVRIYFGDGGPNATSSFHVIGEIFDKVYSFASLTAPPLTNVQTITTPPGGASIVEFKLQVPGKYMIVDHALSRMERGLAGILQVDGPANPEIYSAPQQSAESKTGH